MISYLPLSHIAAQMMVRNFEVGILLVFYLSVCNNRLQDINAPLHCGLTIHFARPDALKGTLLETLKVS